MTRAMTLGQAGAILASLYLSVHKTPPPPDVPFLRDWINGASRGTGGMPRHIGTDILTLIELLPPGDGLCHAELHPGTVIMTPERPQLLTLAWAVRGRRHRPRAHRSHP